MNSVQKALFTLTCGLACFSLKAQSYSHSPNDTLISYTSLDMQVTMNITQLHTGNDTLQFSWNRISVEKPTAWEANICDNSQCYDSLVFSGITLPILPGDNGLMLVHCTPHITTGTAIIRYAIHEINNPLQVDTLTWIIHASEAGINSQIGSPLTFKYTSNGYLNFINSTEDFDELRLFNSLGQLVQTERLHGQSQIKVAGELSGIYWIQLFGKRNIINKKIYITE